MSDLKKAIADRQVRRLCHFTPSRNVAHILAGKRGIVATASLSADVREVFNPTDLERLDGFPDHVCCSIEYPNAWYFRKARKKEVLFRDWAVITISADALSLPGVKFSPRNAAAGAGRYVVEGLEGFGQLYVRDVVGAHNQVYRRGPQRNPAIPTDEQAEVLVPDLVPFSMITGIVVSSADQARTEIGRLKMAGLDFPPFSVASHFYDPATLSSAIRNGNVPAEVPYDAAED